MIKIHLNIFLKIIVLLLIISVITSKLPAQQTSFSAIGGITYGGPLPISLSSNKSGNPLIGLVVGMQANYKLKEKLSINLQLNYSFKRLEYAANYHKDTLIPQIINNVSIRVPSYYTAYIKGNMSLHYLDLYISSAYKISKKHSIDGGIYFSYLLGGYDKGNVQVVIGEGGFYGDYFQSYNNITAINKLDMGLSLGMKTYWYKKMFTGFKITRSFKSFYNNKFDNRGLDNTKLYNTYFNLYIGMDI